MPKRKSPEGPEGKDASKVTKQESPEGPEGKEAFKVKESPEGPEGKEASKVTKQAPPVGVRRSERVQKQKDENPKKAAAKKVPDDKGAKAKKGGGKAKKDDGPAQNGETKTNEVTEGAEEATEEKA